MGRVYVFEEDFCYLILLEEKLAGKKRWKMNWQRHRQEKDEDTPSYSMLISLTSYLKLMGKFMRGSANWVKVVKSTNI